MTLNLNVLHICIPGKGWQDPQVFAEDNGKEQAELDELILDAKRKGYTVATNYIPGSAVEPLHKYLNREK